MEWKRLDEFGFTGYEMSEYGEMRSYWTVSRRGGNIVVDEPQRILKTFVDKSGYKCIRVTGGKRKLSAKIHRLVAMAFLGSSDLPLVCHKDGNRQNNHYTNLYWGTPMDNTMDMVRMGNALCGEKGTQSKLTESDVAEIKKLYLDGMDINSIARKYSVVYSCIYSILSGTKWKHTGPPTLIAGDGTKYSNEQVR